MGYSAPMMPTSPNSASVFPTPAGPVLAVCGWSGSGKTTLLDRVIPEITARGLSVAALKHDAHGLKVDPRGKDSDRLFRAGADVVLHAPGQSLIRRHAPAGGELPSVVAALLGEYDLVLVEGHKGTPLPKVWLRNEAGDDPPPEVTEILHDLPWDSDRPSAFLHLLDSWLPTAWRRPPVHAGVLIGGGSRRMGRPKHLLRVDGRTFVEHAVETLSPLVDGVVLLGSGDLPASCRELPCLPDPPGLGGPLSGILGALRWAPAATWMVVACDLPRIGPEAISWLLDQRAPGVHAVLPRRDAAGVEPLLALYDARVRVLLERLAAARCLAPSALAPHARVQTPIPPKAILGSWQNVNTPEDLARISRPHEADSGEISDSGAV